MNQRYRTANHETVVLNGLYFPFVDLLSSLAVAVVLGFGGYLFFGGSVTIGTLFAFVGYLANFFDPVQQLSQLYNTFLAAVAALDKIIDVLEEEPEIEDAPGAQALPAVDGHVRFEHVRFGYGDGPEVLHGLDLDVPAGTTVALVGHTGAGKSTIAKLLARFYDPREGRITIDGHDLREVTQQSLQYASSGSSRRKGSCSPARSATTSPSRGPTATAERGRRGGRGRRRRRLRPSAAGRLRDPGRRARQAGSRSASASSSRSRGRSSPTRASSSSTRRPRASTSRPSAGSRQRSGGSSPAGRRSSSPTGSRRSARPT